MSNDNKISNEDELWDVLNSPVTESKKPDAPAAEPIPVTEPTAPAEKAHAKSGRTIDKFFIGCMAGVAAVSVAATLLISGMVGGGTTTPGGSASLGGQTGGDSSNSAELQALQEENEQLKNQVSLQQKNILDLQNSLMELMGTEEYLANAATDPTGGNEVLDKQTEAFEILVQIQEAYAEFDREKLEELIPQMDERLEYLTPEALNSYYLVLEYMEQPSNG